MYSGLCHLGTGQSVGYATWGSLGSLSTWGWIGLVLNVAFWLGLLAGLVLLTVWVIRRARVQAATVSYATGPLTATEVLQARYARGEITREQYERMKRDLG